MRFEKPHADLKQQLRTRWAAIDIADVNIEIDDWSCSWMRLMDEEKKKKTIEKLRERIRIKMKHTQRKKGLGVWSRIERE